MSTPDPWTLERALDAALSTGADYADVFCEDLQTSTLNLEDDRLDKVQFGHDRGAGIRVLFGEVVGFASVDGWDADALVRGARAAAAAATRETRSTWSALAPPVIHDGTPQHQPPGGADLGIRADLAWRANRAARAGGPLVRQVSTRYTDSVQLVTIANSEGLLTRDRRNHLQLTVNVTAEREGVRQAGRTARGGQVGLELFERTPPEVIAQEATASAIAMLDAVPAPAGAMPVVIGSGWGGVLFHEAVGHGLEVDHVYHKGSVYEGKVGQMVASPLVTLVDDGTVAAHRGSFAVDDEGAPSARNVLIEKGVLRAFLTDRKYSRLMTLPCTGNGRRQSYMHPPVPRMTNLYTEPGESTPDEIIRATKRGLYVRSLGGGQVETASGQFVFSVTEGYLIEDGRLTTPVRGATIAGDALSVLQRIDMVANDFAMDPGMGNCGKAGQWVAVGVGQPTLRVSELIVGGTNG